MNKQKLTYLSPETETLVVRFEGVVCTSPDYSPNGLQQGNINNGGGAFDDWDD